MRMFTITYDRGGRIATATVQGTEITTTDDSLCICEDGTPLATFPKQSVLHVTSNSPGDNRPAPAVDDLGMPLRSLHNARAEGREEYWGRLRTALDPTPPHAGTGRVARRTPTTGGSRRGYVGGAPAAGPGDSVPSSGARAR